MEKDNFTNQSIGDTSKKSETTEQQLKTAVEIVEQKIKASQKPETSGLFMDIAAPAEKIPSAMDIAMKKTAAIEPIVLKKLPQNTEDEIPPKIPEQPPLKNAAEIAKEKIAKIEKQELADSQNSSEQPAPLTGETNGIKPINVRRSNGEIEHDWILVKTNEPGHIRALKSELIPGTNRYSHLEKIIPQSEFEELNPEYSFRKSKKIVIPGSFEYIVPDQQSEIIPKENTTNKTTESEEIKTEQLIREEDEAMASVRQNTSETAKKSETGEIIEEALPKKIIISPENKITPQQERVQEVLKELAALAPEKRKSWFEGVAEFGYRTQEWKGNFFSRAYGKIEKKLAEKGKTHAEQSAMARFVGELRHSYEETAQQAHEGRKKIREGTLWDKTKHTGLSAATLVGNAALYGRVAYDAYSHIKGFNIANPFRYVTMAAMAFARGGEATKETVLEGRKNIEKTRIADEDEAAKEAWAIYNKAKETAGAENREVSKEYLQHEYEAGLTESIKNQFAEDPVSANKTLSQGLARWYLNQCMKSLQKELFDASYDANNQTELKKCEAVALKKHAKLLKDLDRMIDRTGKINLIALGSDILSKSGKAVATAMAIDTLYRGGMLLEQVQWKKLTAPFAEQAGKLISSFESQGDKLGVALGILEAPDESFVQEITEQSEPKIVFRQDGEPTEHSLKETADDIAQNSEKIHEKAVVESSLSPAERQWLEDTEKALAKPEPAEFSNVEIDETKKTLAENAPQENADEIEKKLMENSIADEPAETDAENATSETDHTAIEQKEKEMMQKSIADEPPEEKTENIAPITETENAPMAEAEQKTETPADKTDEPPIIESESNGQPPATEQPAVESEPVIDAESTEISEKQIEETGVKEEKDIETESTAKPEALQSAEIKPSQETPEIEMQQPAKSPENETAPEPLSSAQLEIAHHIETKRAILQEMGLGKDVASALPDNLLADVEPMQLNAFEIAYHDLGIGNFGDQTAIQNYTTEALTILTSGNRDAITDWIQEYRNAMLENGAENPAITAEYINARVKALQNNLGIHPDIHALETAPQTLPTEPMHEIIEPEPSQPQSEKIADEQLSKTETAPSVEPQKHTNQFVTEGDAPAAQLENEYTKKIDRLKQAGISQDDINALTQKDILDLNEVQMRHYENNNVPHSETPTSEEPDKLAHALEESQPQASKQMENDKSEFQELEIKKSDTSPLTENEIKHDEIKTQSHATEKPKIEPVSSQHVAELIKDPTAGPAIEIARDTIKNQESQLRKTIEKIQAVANESQEGKLVKIDRTSQLWRLEIQRQTLEELMKRPYAYAKYLPEEKAVLFEGDLKVPGKPGDPIKEFIMPFKIRIENVNPVY